MCEGFDEPRRGRPRGLTAWRLAAASCLLALTGWGASARAATVIVEMRNNFFSPALVTIDAGDTVTWVQRGSNHDTVSYDGLWASDFLRLNQTFSFTFDTPGEYRYYCSPHEQIGMIGTVRVRAAQNAAPSVSLSVVPDGILAAPANVLLQAAASDAEGSVSRVEFFQGAQSLGAVLTPPYEITVTGLASGLHSFTAVATDNGGAAGASAAVAVRVAARPEILSITRNNGNSVIRVAGTAGLPHILEQSADFLLWTALATNTPATDQSEFSDPAQQPRRIYRVTVR